MSWQWPARARLRLKQIARDFGISEGALQQLVEESRHRGRQPSWRRPRTSAGRCVRLKKRIRLLEQENEVLRVLPPICPGESAGKIVFPLVREMAAAGAPIRVPVAVACRVLGLLDPGVLQVAQGPGVPAGLGRRTCHQRPARASTRTTRPWATGSSPTSSPTLGISVVREPGVSGCARSRDLRLPPPTQGPRPASPARRSTTTCWPWSTRQGRVTGTSSPPTAPNQVWLTDITEHWTGRREALPVRGQGRATRTGSSATPSTRG